MAKKFRYLVVIERGEHNYGGYVPDLDGCVTVGDSPELGGSLYFCISLTAHVLHSGKNIYAFNCLS